MSKIRITIPPGKPVTVKVEGIPGEQCHAVSRPYEDAIGGKVIKTESTPEANQPAFVSEANRVNEGF